MFSYKTPFLFAYVKKKPYLCSCKGFDTMTTQNQMFNFTPPSRENVAKLFLLALLGLFFIGVFVCGYRAASSPVEVSSSVFCDPDSLLYYAERAFLDEDPRGLFVTGAAAYLKWQDPASFPASCTTVSRDEADIMLLRAAELGNPDARQLILCLHKNGVWKHSLPENK